MGSPDTVSIELIINVSDDHPVFKGHFPGNPIVPGALLMQWIASSVADNIEGYRLVGVKSFKFLSPVTPGNRLVVTIEMKEAAAGGNLFAAKTLCTNHSAADEKQIACKGVLLLSAVEAKAVKS